MSKKDLRIQPKKVLTILHNRQESFLSGCILSFKYIPGGSPVKPRDKSAMFTVAETLGADEEVVYGSIDFLVRNIKHLVDNAYEEANSYNKALGHVPLKHVARGERSILYQLPEELCQPRKYFEFRRCLSSTLILMSAQARNLFELFPHLDRKINLRDRTGNRTGGISLTRLFPHLVHSQYLFLKGEYVADLFPAKPRKEAPITRSFMGYRFNWIEYIQLIEDTIRSLKVKKLHGLIARPT